MKRIYRTASLKPFVLINQLISIGIDLVHDEVEKALLEEVETVRNCEKKLEQFTDKCANQVRRMFIDNMR